MDKAAWYRLDNVGKFYSAQAGDPKQTVFRISAVMRREVRPDVLQQALEATVGQLPSFNVVLRSGLFWRYLQQAPEVPQVQPENQPVCFGLHAGRKSVLYRVSYFRDRINLEMSHMIADGRGALAFLKTLLEFYAELLRHEAPSPEALAMLEEQGGGNTAQEAEDSFSRYFDKSKAGATPSTRPYRLAGWRNEANPTFMEVHLPVAGVVAAAKGMGVSVTSFLVAALVQALRAGMSTGAENRPITMDVPVDLRSVYGSETLRNFFGLAFISCSPQLATGPLDAIARDVQRQLTDATIPANLARRMNQMVKLEKNPVVRWVPSFVKDAALALGDWKARREVTCTFSNLGRVVLPPAAAAEVRSIGCLTSTRGLNFLAVSCEDDLTLGIASVYLLHEVPCRLVRILAAQGLEARLCVAKDAAEVDADLAQASLELRLRHQTWEEAMAVPQLDCPAPGAASAATAAAPSIAPPACGLAAASKADDAPSPALGTTAAPAPAPVAELGPYFRQAHGPGGKKPQNSEHPEAKAPEIPSSPAPVAELGPYFRQRSSPVSVQGSASAAALAPKAAAGEGAPDVAL